MASPDGVLSRAGLQSFRVVDSCVAPLGMLQVAPGCRSFYFWSTVETVDVVPDGLSPVHLVCLWFAPRRVSRRGSCSWPLHGRAKAILRGRLHRRPRAWLAHPQTAIDGLHGSEEWERLGTAGRETRWARHAGQQRPWTAHPLSGWRAGSLRDYRSFRASAMLARIWAFSPVSEVSALSGTRWEKRSSICFT